jgi:hypothetical protein
MTNIAMPRRLWDAASHHLNARAEQVGFFLAQWDAGQRRLDAFEWRAVPPEGLHHQSDFHVSLGDATRADVIKWAWDSDACLVEAHSHGPLGPAGFSPSDLYGFEQWVPHLWWRLRARPYAAIVTAGSSIDGLAWVDGASAPEQVDAVDLEDGDRLLCTRATLSPPRRWRDRPNG